MKRTTTTTVARAPRAGWLAAIGLALALAGPAPGSTGGATIGQQVDIDTYQHYLEDLLYTHLGDDRGSGPEHDLARDNIFDTLEALRLPVVLEPFVYSASTYHNIVATQTGLDDPDEVVIVGAHFDSVNNPGADDNGTGTALVMEIARVLSRHRSSKTIRYVLFDREEQGRRGSIAFVADHAAENIVMAVTADMVGHDSGFYTMDVYGTNASAGVVNGVAAAIDEYGAGLGRVLNFGNYSFSDHWSFESVGIPACVIIERCFQCNANYHTPNDAVDVSPGYISYPMLEALARSVVGHLVDTVGITVWGDLTGPGAGDPPDGRVNVFDLLLLLSNFGSCGPPESVPGDLTGPGPGDPPDGCVNVFDLLLLLENWG